MASIIGIRRTFSYDPLNGRIFRRGYGTISTDKDFVIVDKRRLKLTTLAWVLGHGYKPVTNVECYDGDKTNLRLINLYVPHMRRIG